MRTSILRTFTPHAAHAVGLLGQRWEAERGSPLGGPIRMLVGGEIYRASVGQVWVIGREAGCDIVLRDSLVSRQHAQIGVLDQFAFVVDLKSRNGVYLESRRVDRVARLRYGDRLLFGTTEVSVFSDSGL